MGSAKEDEKDRCRGAKGQVVESRHGGTRAGGERAHAYESAVYRIKLNMEEGESKIDSRVGLDCGGGNN